MKSVYSHLEWLLSSFWPSPKLGGCAVGRSHRLQGLESVLMLPERNSINGNIESEVCTPLLFLDILIRSKQTRSTRVILIKSITDLKGMIYRQGLEFEISKVYVRTAQQSAGQRIWRLDVVDEISHFSDSKTGRLGIVYLTESRQRIFSESSGLGLAVNIEKSIYSSRVNCCEGVREHNYMLAESSF